jgi:hypothetical protein
VQTGVVVQNARTAAVLETNTQWIELLLLETTDLSDCVIEYRSVAAPEEEAYQEFYRFATGTTYLAGTLLRVHNGFEPTTAAEQQEAIYVYADHSSFSFSSQGTWVRLKNKAGIVLHTRVLYGESAFTEWNASGLRNADGTRMFLYCVEENQSITPLANGIYQLKFTYQRDIGPDKPLLKRFGFSATEEAIICFSLSAAELLHHAAD